MGTRDQGRAADPSSSGKRRWPMHFSSLRAVVLASLLIAPQACHRDAPHLEIIAPALEASRAGFTSYDLMPVGEFAAKRGERMPFIDADRDGRFSPGIEASGRCDQKLQECVIDDHRLRIISSNTSCPLTNGLWLIGNVYDRTGRGVPAVLCDERGACSTHHEHVFGDMPVDAIWIPDLSGAPRRRTLSLEAGLREFRFENVELPEPMRLLDTKTERRDDLRIAVTADHSVDMAAVRVMRGRALHWSSSRQPARMRASGRELIVELPGDVVDSCGDGCEAFVQLAHVWRDDELLSVSQVEHRLF